MFDECEIVFFDLWDVGTSIDLNQIIKLFPSSQKRKFRISKKTPKNIILPEPLNIHLEDYFPKNVEIFEKISIFVQFYEDGVISFITRSIVKKVSLEELDLFRKTQKVKFPNKAPISLKKWINQQFQHIYAQIRPFITKELYKFNVRDPESYSVFCIRDKNINASNFVETQKDLVAKFLSREHSNNKLHHTQITDILNNKFSYFEKDLLLFESERALIFDPYRDYEDILAIVELSNYMSLELQNLDFILDKWLKDAEIESTFLFQNKNHRQIKLKAKRIQQLRIDALFMLENIENVSKIIGNFFLGEIYKHICNLFDLSSWITSIRARIAYLTEVYSLSIQNSSEDKMWKLELLMALFFSLEIILFLIDIIRV
ncbi:hypothetical protein NEF87_001177 [Candidatus Lokiarchaeum ossiferum]|uniref:DUF155 domain-containing protein n=1 Tax=Candidatus Lokiarchaeum ossiferum TaxID=2951803 RepID=A0ABY6HPS1_9ARCH|nr:hypothetical protein NEF87_001177 [Candidatus Lokiarchaeum sp. B-35]